MPVLLAAADSFAHFAQLTKAIAAMIRTGHAPYPVERTLLTTGILDAVMTSRHERGRRIASAHLDIAYTPTDWPPARGDSRRQTLILSRSLKPTGMDGSSQSRPASMRYTTTRRRGASRRSRGRRRSRSWGSSARKMGLSQITSTNSVATHFGGTIDTEPIWGR